MSCYTRFTQRIGRTGRQRIGQVMMLVTEGKEQNNLRSVLASKDDTNQKIANNSRIKSSLLKTLPLLIPPQFKPKCLKTFLKVPVLPEVPKKVRKNAKVVEKPEEGPSTSRNHNKENKKIPSLNKFFRNFDKNAGDNPVAEENCSDVSILMNTSRTLKMSPEDQFDCFHKKISNMKCTPARSTENMEASKVLMNEAYPKMLKKMILEKDKNFLKDIVESESLLTAMEMDDDVVDLDSLEKTRKSFKAVKCVFGSIENVKSLLKVGQQNFRKVSAINKFDKLFAAPISITNLQDIIEKCQNMLDQSYVDSDTSMRPQHIISDMDSEQPAFVQNESKYHEQTNTSWNSALATKNNIFNSTIKTPCSDSKKSHKPKSIKKVTTPISESPLLKYFQKTIIKRNSNCSTPKVSFTETSARSKLDEKAVLGYLGLSSIDDIWMDNDSDEVRIIYFCISYIFTSYGNICI